MEGIVKWRSYIAGTTVCPSGATDRDLNTLEVSIYNAIKAPDKFYKNLYLNKYLNTTTALDSQKII